MVLGTIPVRRCIYSQMIGDARHGSTIRGTPRSISMLGPPRQDLVPDGHGGIEMILRLIDHQPVGAATNGLTARFPLQPMSGATSMLVY